MDGTCPICVESFTEKSRKRVSCPYCQHSACVKCLKQYLLSSHQNPNCMNCHVEFNREFLDIHLTVTFRMKEYKLHRENVLVEREKSMLPATVPFVEQAHIEKENKIRIHALRDRKTELKRQITQIDEEIYQLERLGRRAGHQNIPTELLTADVEVQRKQFIKACVVTDCRGFLSSQWKCGVCNTYVCPDCHEQKLGKTDEEHVCDPNNVASAKLIARETKPCPLCAACIFRVSGCSQMWCPQCHTTFDWNSGREVKTTNIHNPHYFDWLRRNANGGEIPRVPGDNPCGDAHVFPTAYSVVNRIGKWSGADKRIQYAQYLHRSILHLHAQFRHQRNATDIESLNRDLRVKFMMKEIEEEDWKKELQKREKKRDFDASKYHVFDMLYQVAAELFQALMQANDLHTVKATLDQIAAIVRHYNESAVAIHERFKSKSTRMMLADDWRIQD